MHVCCPQCGNSIELVDDSDFQSIDCPGCGSSFGLVDVDQAGIETLQSEQVESRVIGNFRLIVEVGRGAYGTVWRAHDIALDRPVAVKLPRQRHTSAADQEQFFREARSVAQLNHPNIVAVHEVGREEEQLFIVSDFVDGITLADKISADPFSQRAAVQLCVTIAGALSHAHDNGIVHRDLKPANIMLTGKDEPRVMDFGLAKRQAGEITMTMEGKVLGTPAYMPPEQARGEGFRVDGRGDIYSLGVILYELLTGELPFRGRTRMLLQQVINDEAPSPRKLNSSIPRDLETITLKCLQKDPAKRYQDAAALSADLECWLEDRPIQARPSTWMERSWRWCRRKPAVASLTVAVTISLLAGIVITSWFAFEANFERNKTEKAQQKLVNSVRDAKNAEAAAVKNRDAALLSAKNEKEAREDLVKAVKAAKDAEVAAEKDRDLAVESEKKTKEALAEVEKAVEAAEKAQIDAEEAAKKALKAETIAKTAQEKQLKTLVALEMSEAAAIEAEARAVQQKILAEAAQKDAEEKEKQVRRQDYQSGMLVAQRDWDNGNVRHLLEVLDRYQDDQLLRGFEWHYWQRLCNDPEKVPTFKGHSDEVSCIAISPDGTRIASGSDDNTVRLWNTENPEKELHKLEGHTGSVRSVAFSPNGKWIVSGSDDSTIIFWTVEGKRLHVLKGHADAVTSVVFSSSGLKIASGSMDQTVWLWDVPDEDVREYEPEKISSRPLNHGSGVWSLAFSPDGRWLASAGVNGKVILWDLSTNLKAKTHQQLNQGTGGLSPVLSLAFSPDETRMRIAAASYDKKVRVWNAERLKPGQEEDSPGDQEKLELVHILEGHRGSVNSVSFDKDGRLFTASDDHTVKKWNLDKEIAKEVFTHKGHRDEVTGVSLSRDGTKIVTSSRDKTIKLWDDSKYEEKLDWDGLGGSIWSVAFSPDGTKVVSGNSDNTVRLWNTKTTEQIEDPLKGHTGSVWSLAFSPEGTQIVSASADSTVRLWDANTQKEIRSLKGHTDSVWSVAFSSDGTRIASGSDDNTVRLWDTETGKPLQTLEGHTDSIRCVAFSLDGKQVVSGSDDQLIKLWDAETGEELQTLEGHTDLVWSVAFSPDGKRVASASKDETIKVWDLAMDMPELTLRGHMDTVRTVSFDQQGRRILSASLDGTVKLWEADSGEELLTLSGYYMDLQCAAFSQDGKWIVAGDKMGNLMLWDGRPLEKGDE